MDNPWMQSLGLVLGICCSLTCVLLTPNSYVGTLPTAHNMMVWGGGSLGRWRELDEIMRAEFSWMSLVSLQESWEIAFLFALYRVRIWKVGILQSRSTPSLGLTMLMPWSQTSSLQNYEKKMFVVYKTLGLWYPVIAAGIRQHSRNEILLWMLSSCGHKVQIWEDTYLPKVACGYQVNGRSWVTTGVDQDLKLGLEDWEEESYLGTCYNRKMLEYQEL